MFTHDQRVPTPAFTIQVSGFNGAPSPLPYFVRVTVISRPPSCRARPATTPDGGTAGSLPAQLDPSTRTLFLVNKERLGDIYGTAEADEVMAKLQTLAATTDPGGDRIRRPRRGRASGW